MLKCSLCYAYGDDDDIEGLGDLKFEAADIDDGREKALQILKRIAKRWRKSTEFYGCFLEMHKGTNFLKSGYVFWLRQSFCKRQALLNAKSSQCWRLIGKGKDVKD